MPEIRPYLPQVSTPGPIGVQRATPESFGSEISDQGQNLGNSLTKFGDVLAQRDAQDDISNIHASLAKAQENLTQQYTDGIQKGTLNHDDFMKSVNDTMDSIQNQVQTRSGNLAFQEMKNQLGIHFSDEAVKGQALLEGDKALSDFKTARDARTSAVFGNPASFQVSLDQQNKLVDDLVATKGLPSTKSDELKRQGMDQLAIGAVRGIMKLNPDDAIKQLDDGKWDPYFGEGTKYKMYVEAERAQRSQAQDEERQQRLLEKQKKAIEEQVSVKFLSQMHDPEGPGLSSKDILSQMQAGNITPQTAEHFWNALDKENQEKKIKSDPGTVLDLQRRLALPDGDPSKITTIDPFNQAIGQGKLSIPDAKMLTSWFIEGKNTPQGEADSAIEKAVFDNIKTRLIKNPMLPDPKGMQIYSDLVPKMYEYAQKSRQNGKSNNQIWSATINGKDNADYVLHHVPVPQRTLEDIVNDMADSIQSGGNSQNTESEGDPWVNVVNPSGTSGKIRSSKLNEKLKQGYKLQGKGQ